ncbi:hypothetical protein [Burkholderia phage vB_BpP_HN03]|uniref:Uncharacterized protein n=1 Tax=Burkholderia phage vB_BpP_HN02 TaxID=3116925 RepID=A0AAX4JI44_9CAUD
MKHLVAFVEFYTEAESESQGHEELEAKLKAAGFDESEFSIEHVLENT